MKIIAGEKWKVLTFHKSAYGKSYAISNHGRLVCFSQKPIDGTLLKGGLQEGYAIWRYKQKCKKGIYKHIGILLHRLVAQQFLPPPQKGENLVIHFNHKKTDNHYTNLAWATIAEATSHAQGSPRVKKARKLAKETGNMGNSKLTIENVKAIKTLIVQGKTLKEVAAKFMVSDMQIYRIKTGKNWSSVK